MSTSHASSLIRAVRSIDLETPTLADDLAFYEKTWLLTPVQKNSQSAYLRATGPHAYVLALHAGQHPDVRIRHITLQARDRSCLSAILDRAAAHGGARVIRTEYAVDEPGGGHAIELADAIGRRWRVVADDAPLVPIELTHAPVRLAHVVINASDVPQCQDFMENVFDFSLSDRTRIMAFMRCADDHHSIAIGDTDNNCLNHIAFLTPDLDSAMMGAGRMRDAGYPVQWGPGRHGPGNNAFNYFVGPQQVVIEYTAEVQTIDDSYPVGSPADWTWPPGRIDQWGIGVMPSGTLKAAQAHIAFVPVDEPAR
ncbi:MAG: VOC family protein [Pigmentiphaga sp.]|nr:VOC family protein [Pigmentiphaga sp.]